MQFRTGKSTQEKAKRWPRATFSCIIGQVLNLEYRVLFIDLVGGMFLMASIEVFLTDLMDRPSKCPILYRSFILQAVFR